MPGLTPLLDRLRGARLPPGTAASALAVPSAGDELTGEVTFLFGDLDAIARRRETLLTAAGSEAAEAEQAAARERSRLLARAREDGERRAAQVLLERRTHLQARARHMVADADREAARVLARGRERTPGVVRDIVERLLEDSR
ncbi:MAG TPA: hypothetical protein VLC49_02930 [Solirubrobacteraceae bacterium]|nr:hypothetical protein [Solirubrobacteraceae bacterium]